jgi:hypothetical protein
VCAVLLALTLTGCGVQPKGDFTVRSLPQAPAYVQPVQTKRPAPGTPWITVAAREKAAKDESNRRIASFLAWYENVRKSYGGPKS